MKLLVLYWAAMIICYFIASKFRDRPEVFFWLDTGTNIIVYAMVAVMGLRMGANDEVTSNLGTIGLQSLLITALTIAGSISFVTILRKILGVDRHGYYRNEQEKLSDSKTSESEADAAHDNENIKTTILITLTVAVSMAAGYFFVDKLFDVDKFMNVTSDIMVVGIVVLLGFIGLGFGITGKVIPMLKEAGFKVVYFPIVIVLGTLAGGIVYGIISPLSMKEAIAVSLGFGWYTYAPGVIAEAGYDIAGAISFMHNVIRETLGIIGIPLFAKLFGYIESTGVPGVASMDICMPIIERSTRQEIIVYGFVTGIAASTTCSIFVPLIINM